MQGSSYFRRQANTCLRLSESCIDQGLADRFQAMAEDFMAKAADTDTVDEGGASHSRMCSTVGVQAGAAWITAEQFDSGGVVRGGAAKAASPIR
jgi:hypothetical protein